MFCGNLVPHLQGSCMRKGHSYTGKWKPWKFKTGRKKDFLNLEEVSRISEVLWHLSQNHPVYCCLHLIEWNSSNPFLLKHFCSLFTSQLQFLSQISSVRRLSAFVLISSDSEIWILLAKNMKIAVFGGVMLHILVDKCHVLCEPGAPSSGQLHGKGAFMCKEMEALKI